MKRLIAALAKLWYRTIARPRLKSNSPCPACGIARKHKMVWDPVRKAVIHVCKRCGANWGVDPVVEVEKWQSEELISVPATESK